MKTIPDHWTDIAPGKFSLPAGFMNSLGFDELALLFNGIVVLRAEYNAMLDQMDYAAVSKYFRCLKEGDLIPEYQITMRAKGDTPRAKAGVAPRHGVVDCS